MRTQPRDPSGTITCGATVPDAASGSGVFQPGAIPFVYTRTGTGVYVFRFDERLRPLSAIGHPTGGGYMAEANVTNYGYVQVSIQNNTGVQVNGTPTLVMTCLDKRT